MGMEETHVNMFKKISKNTVAAQVINQITDLIKGGRLTPGDRLPSERVMAEMLGVSRPPLRESLKVLEYAGVIETRYGDGIYVKSSTSPLDNTPLFSRLLNQYTLEEMIEMRKVVELAAVRFAIDRATDDDFDALQNIQSQTRKSTDDLEKFIECDFLFHSTIAETTHNAMLFNTVQTMRNLMGEFNRELLEDKSFREKVCKQHKTILAAIVKRDKEAAVAAMSEHLDNVVNMALDSHDKDPKKPETA